MASSKKLFERRRLRTRAQIRKHSRGRLRLSVFRSGRHIYAQVIDDRRGVTLAAASSMDKDIKGESSCSANKQTAEKVGKLVAVRALAMGIKEVVFDRGGYKYHGRVKALADKAREAGLSF